MVSKKNFLSYPSSRSKRNSQVQTLIPTNISYKSVRQFLKEELNIALDNEPQKQNFIDIFEQIFNSNEENTIFKNYLSDKTDYASMQFEVKMILQDFLTLYQQETGISLISLGTIDRIGSAQEISSLLDIIGYGYGLVGGNSSILYSQLRQMLPDLLEKEQKFSQAYSDLQKDSETKMSELRSKLYNFEQTKLNTSKPIEDNFAYAFFRTIKGSDGIEKLKVEFLDAEAVARQQQIQNRFNFSNEGLFRSITSSQQIGFTDQDFLNMRTTDSNLLNLAARINSDSDFLQAILDASKVTYTTKNGEMQTLGLGRAADILFRDYDYNTGWSGNFPQLYGDNLKKILSENIPGLLMGDKTFDVASADKITRYQISVKTQDNSKIKIDYMSNSIIENMNFLAYHPDLLAEILLDKKYSDYKQAISTYNDDNQFYYNLLTNDQILSQQVEEYTTDMVMTDSGWNFEEEAVDVVIPM